MSRARVVRAVLVANVVGGLVVFNVVGFLLPLFVEAEERDRLGLINLGVLVVFTVVGLALNFRITRPFVVRTRAWLETGADPADARHRDALRAPYTAAHVTARVWGIGAVLFGALNIVLSSLVVGVAVTVVIALGGLTTGALLYLMAERATRPLTAAALRAGLPPEPVAPGVRARLVVAWTFGTGVPLAAIVALAVGGWVGSEASIEELSVSVLFVCLVALTVGMVAVWTVARSIAEPVATVRHALARVGRGDYDLRLAVDDGSEVGLLQAGFNEMADGLRERERLRDLFGRHVGRDVAQRALTAELELGGEVREVAALFVDLIGSTTLAAERPPEEVVTLLNSFFAVVVDAVERHGGLVNKFEGDAALAVFGAPVECDDPAGDALAAARVMAERLASELPEVRAGIGVSAGRAVAGNVGALERFEYTVIGDPVNEAARLCELAKTCEPPVLASDAAVERAGRAERDRWRLGEPVRLRGRATDTRPGTPVARADG